MSIHSQISSVVRSQKHLALLCSILTIVLFLATSGDANAQAKSQAAIESLNSSINVLPSGDADVVETIKISYGSDRSKHQFYRVLPLHYAIKGVDHEVAVRIRSISCDGGKTKITSSDWAAGGELYMAISVPAVSGDVADKLGNVEHTFSIDYEIHRAVNFISGAPQLYLNVSGNQWSYPIKHVETEVQMPRGVDLSKVRVHSISTTGGGNPGTDPPVFDSGKILFRTTNLSSGDGVIIVADMPRGSVVLPSVLQEFVWNLQSIYQVFVLPVAVVIILTGYWFLYGRDPGPVKAAALTWRPPDYLTPAELGTLIDESCDLSDVVSTVMDLAVRGFIKIRVVPFNGLLYLSNKDFQFTLLKKPTDKELKAHEQLFLSGLFGLSETTYLTALRGDFASYIPLLRHEIYQALLTEKQFERDPEVDRRNFTTVGAAVVTVGIALLVASAMHLGGKATAIGTVISGIILLAAAGAMPKRTAAGVTALRQAQIFQQNVTSGSAEIKTLAGEEPEAFSRYLPHAIVLGVGSKWARLFEQHLKEYPEWFEIDPAFVPDTFSAIKFVRELEEGLNLINRALMEEHRMVVSSGISDQFDKTSWM